MKTESPLKKVGECLYRNHCGTYFALVKVNGKQIKRSLKTEDATLAKRRLSEFRIKAQKLTGKDTGIVFEGLAARWLAVKKPDLKENSYERLDSIVRHAMPFFKGLPVRSVGQNQVEKWKLARSAKIGARSFNYERDSLRALFEYGRTNLRIILENPLDTVKRRKMDRRQIVIPSKEQFRTLLATLQAEPRAHLAASFVEFLAYSGLRRGEAREVRWQDVNFDMNTLVVTGGEMGTKNRESRVLPLFAPLRRLLERLGAGLVVLGPAKIFDLDSAKKALITACRKSGLPQYGHHAMRHFFCSNAIEAGCDFKVIAEWLGHKDGGVLVAKTYGHLRAEHSVAMARRITFDASAENEQPANVVQLGGK